MDKTFIGNDEAFLNLNSYAMSQNPGPLILLGNGGLVSGRQQWMSLHSLWDVAVMNCIKTPTFSFLTGNRIP